MTLNSKDFPGAGADTTNEGTVFQELLLASAGTRKHLLLSYFCNYCLQVLVHLKKMQFSRKLLLAGVGTANKT